MKKRPSFFHIHQPKNVGQTTRAIRTQLAKTQYHEHTPPMFLTSSYWFDDCEEMGLCFADETDGFSYSRYSNPNTDEFAAKLAGLEGVEAGIATASGMGAIFAALMSQCSQGDHILATRSLFGSTYQLLSKQLPKWGIETTFVDTVDADTWQQHIRPETKIFFLETPTNPGLEIIDLSLARAFCDVNKLLLVIDNCFATPCLQQPVKFGADIIIHSATKFIDGQGRVLAGAVLGSREIIERNYMFLRQTGAALSPFNAWLLARSIDTLALRMKAHCENALQLATWFEQHKSVTSVRYPGLASHPQHNLAMKQMRAGGGVVSFELPGGVQSCVKVLDSLSLLTLSANLGDVRTIVTHPASTTHARLSADERSVMGVTDGLIRVSVGLEDIEDIICAFEQTFSTHL